MLSSFIKFFALILWALYSYVRILNIKSISIPKKIVMAFFSVCLSFLAVAITFYFYDYSSGTIIIILVSLSFMFSNFILTNDHLLCFSVTIISYGVSMGIKLVASVVTALIECLIIDFQPSKLIMYLILFTIHSALTVLFFHIKRFKNGLPFLYNSNTRYIGIIISIFILSFYDIASDSRYSSSIIREALVKLAVLSLLLFFWSKGNLSILYSERQKAKELDYAYSIINEKDAFILRLQTDNEKMSKIIHRDNKLIPSLDNAVRSFISEDLNTNTDLKAKSHSLLMQLDELVKDRSGLILECKPVLIKLPKTKLVLIDMMADYMLHKAKESGAELHLEVMGDLYELTQLCITEKDLCTAFADLIENALISVSLTKERKIAIQLGLQDGYQSLSVSDSGIPFEPHILYQLGKKQKTTHADIGGSGIGILALFDINKKAKASFAITEYAPGTNTYTKKVSIIFDSKNEYRINSYRSDILKKNYNRSDILFNQLI